MRYVCGLCLLPRRSHNQATTKACRQSTVRRALDRHCLATATLLPSFVCIRLEGIQMGEDGWGWVLGPTKG